MHMHGWYGLIAGAIIGYLFKLFGGLPRLGLNFG